MNISINGVILPSEDAKVSVLDRGFLYGDAIFETMAVYDGIIFRFIQHWQRFNRSAELLGIPVPFSANALKSQLDAVLEANGYRSGILRVSLTRGVSPRGLGTEHCSDQSLVILCFPPKMPLAATRPKGAKIVVSRFRRVPDSAVPSAAKTANYLGAILAYREATMVDADEALMLTVDEHVAEGTVSNIFFGVSGELITPSVACGIIPGITRGAIIELAGDLGISVHETLVPRPILRTADEIFYTNTTGGVVPVGAADGRLLTAPGPLTRRIRDAYFKLVANEAGAPWFAMEENAKCTPLDG